MAKDISMPDISSMKLGDMRKELNLYAIDSNCFVEKDEFTKALDHARKNLPRPKTTYREVEEPEPEATRHKSKDGGGGGSSGKRTERSKASSKPATTSSSAASRNPGATPASIPPASATAPPTPAASDAAAATKRAKKSLAARSPVVALQQIIEHPSGKILGERHHSFLPGAIFSFSLKGSLHESDAGTVRVPDGVCLRISSASIDRKTMESFLLQKGSVGISLRVATEENPVLVPIWTFDRDRSKSYTVTDLGIEICGPRTMKLLAYMEMGYSSRVSVDLHVFGAVGFDADQK